MFNRFITSPLLKNSIKLLNDKKQLIIKRSYSCTTFQNKNETTDKITNDSSTTKFGNVITYPQMDVVPKKPKICIGLSGGVDSTVAAHLLKQQGFDVTGVFIKSWDEKEETGYCTGEKDFQDAQKVAKWLDIPLYHADFVKDYWNRVFVQFLDDYRNGITPNPDVFCNREIKFDLFIDFAQNLGADYIATGHYSNLRYQQDGSVRLYRGLDKNKDQTYFLCMTKGEKLAKSLFPLGNLEKKDIINYALSLGFNDIASKKSSRGICFIGKRPLPEFLSQYMPVEPGRFIDISRTYEILQQHKGAIAYTIGQKANIHSVHGKYYVVSVDYKKNIVYVCPVHLASHYLETSTLTLRNFNWINEIPSTLKRENVKLEARCQYRHRADVVPCQIEFITSETPDVEKGLTYKITFPEKQKSIASGQIVCLFDKYSDKCYGGGIIDTVETNKLPI
ncbi:tRNA (5-methylaminomethyl-2-thiouridylate)-methyltransferase [Tieghemostelium lacteum]|uniref:tRNA-5-taurinomethyluridine 2-sulfurtransferase n=1 Tax=Tieghemostelium lacteum TaxID=361077 RepID=A0A152A1N2_TIELA|nr:tRNA (5-methylaminomethyl-2-thiouridylate)-methyltransferase [Tieghemostelium lacteum]|eukprot:KYQ99980.1 tRNA (5-methylaminomethyl-2-thiouridylate)-methyltransferase [Tieghemostelium lacteum]